MPRNGSGVYSLPAGNPVVTGTTIDSVWANNTMSDIATALTGSLSAALMGADGLAVRTSSSTWAARTLTAPASGLTITNPAGIAGNPTFALANDLAGLEGLASNGIAVRTATDTWAVRTLAAPASGLTITNPAGVAGDPTFALANDLAGLEALGGQGFATRTAADTWAQRQIAVSGGLTITNPLGIAGDPSITTDGTFFRVTQTTTFSGTGAVLRTGTPNPIGSINGAGNNDKTALAITNAGNSSASAIMSFNREGVYAIHFGLDSDNLLKFGGWSEGTNAYEIWHDKNGAAKLAAGVKAAINTAYTSTQATTGLVELPDGFYLAWILSGVVADDANYAISWSSAFPNTCYNVTGSVLNPTTGNDDVFLRVIAYDRFGANVRAETAGSPNGASRQLMLWGIGR